MLEPADIVIKEYERPADPADREDLEEDIARGERAIADGDLHEWADVKLERLLHVLASVGNRETRRASSRP